MPHADARPAGAFQHAGPGVQKVGQRAVGRKHGQHLARARRDGEAHLGAHRFALQHGCHRHQVGIAGICAAANAHLVHFLQGKAFSRFYIIRRMGAGNKRLQCREVYLQHFVVYGILVGAQGHIVLAAALRRKEGARHIVGRENAGGGAQFCTHVGDGGALRHRKACHAVAAVFNNLAHAALHGHAAQHFQNHVLGAHHGAQLAGEFYQGEFRVGDIIGAAAHGNGNIQPACAHGKAANAACGGGMAVGTNQRFTGLCKPFQMHLVANAVARARIAHADSFCNGADKAVVVRVHEAALQGVVVDICYAKLCFHTGNAHGLIFQICHGASGVLCEGLVDAKAHLAAGSRGAVHKVRRNDFLCKRLSHRLSFLFFILAPAVRRPVLYLFILFSCLFFVNVK